MNLSSINLPTMEKLKQEKARRSMIGFTKYTMPAYDINWHHEQVGKKLDELAEGKIKRLMVFMPPRHGKSELVSRRFPAYILGKYPDAGIIATSYSGSLSSAMNRDVQRIMEDDTYYELFPDTMIPRKGLRTGEGNYIRNSDTFEIVGRKGK